MIFFKDVVIFISSTAEVLMYKFKISYRIDKHRELKSNIVEQLRRCSNNPLCTDTTPKVEYVFNVSQVFTTRL